jgi:hypothetical protein
MRSGLVGLVLVGAVVAVAQEPATISQAELVRRTQVMYDAVAPGDKGPWRTWLAEDAIVHDEKGGAYTKATFLPTVTPMPAGYSGTIKVTHPETVFAPGVAIFSYDTDEVETVFGNRMTARYHQTDTWLYRNGVWQSAASQVMRYYEDPAAIALTAAKLGDYVGTYELAPGKRMSVRTKDGKLFAERDGKSTEMFPEAPDLFFRNGVEGRRLFRRGAQGKVDALIDRRNNEDMVWHFVPSSTR